jgi:Na+-transporting methylmalonyl-CoA/oxaloacetate decarboxylase beta subunit
VDASGEVVRNDPVGYSFLWIGMVAAMGVLLSGILAFALAAPAGILIARLLDRWKGQKKTASS